MQYDQKSPSSNLTVRPMARGLLAALFTAGCSIMALSLMPGMDPRRLPYVFIIVFVFGLFGSQMQERMRLNSD